MIKCTLGTRKLPRVEPGEFPKGFFLILFLNSSSVLTGRAILIIYPALLGVHGPHNCFNPLPLLLLPGQNKTF